MATTEHNEAPGEAHGETRRDFLYVATGAVAAVGAGAVVWPFIDQMNPDAASLAMASVSVDVSGLGVGESMTVMWRGKPVFVRHRTDEEVAAGKEVSVDDLRDPLARNPNLDGDQPATDINRASQDNEAMLVMIGVCTHLGCIPLGQQGDYGGWFCPCHGSHYDTAGRIRQGPAPENLIIPPYAFDSETTLIIG